MANRERDRLRLLKKQGLLRGPELEAMEKYDPGHGLHRQIRASFLNVPE